MDYTKVSVRFRDALMYVEEWLFINICIHLLFNKGHQYCITEQNQQTVKMFNVLLNSWIYIKEVNYIPFTT